MAGLNKKLSVIKQAEKEREEWEEQKIREIVGLDEEHVPENQQDAEDFQRMKSREIQ
jgi:hypothetical protein